MSAVALNPNETRNGLAQQDLTTLIGDRPDLLRQVPWTRTKTAAGQWSHPRPGVSQTYGYERQALINDFERAGIPIQVRLDVDVLRELTRDPEATELVVRGPGRLAWAMPHMRIADEDYVVDGQWRDFPAFFANWLNHEAFERPEFGAEFTISRKEKEVVAGEEVVVRRNITRPARALFAWRMPVDAAAGERPSGLVVPTAARVNLLEDEDALPAGFDETTARHDTSAITSGPGRKRG